jgi:protein involved in polysaccharide export with SLBB domain
LLQTTTLLAAEASGSAPFVETAVVVESVSTNSPQAGTKVTAANLSGYVPDDKYKLRAGDKVAFQILEDRDLPKSLALADSGELDVPYIGRVVAKDKSCKQLVEEIKALLEKEYYHRATVIIALDSASKYLGRIYVWGRCVARAQSR